jgi:hydroxymethylpyrimidine/phosphomethylpyrimidine kinase
LTAQNTKKLKRIELISADLVAEQLDVLLEDIQPDAAKTGALGSAETVEVVAERVERYAIDLVIDPVVLSKHGRALVSDSGVERLRERLLPTALLVTPNRSEAELLARRTICDRQSARDAAKAIADLGVEAVLLKGGHGPERDEAIDTLLWKDDYYEFSTPRIDSRHTHGVGCTLSSAIVAQLAKGRPLVEAVNSAKQWLTTAIATSPGIGQGVCAVNHHAYNK